MPAAIDERLILQSALQVWRAHGYRDATTRKVAALARVSEMTLFRRFGDKPKLFGAALAEVADEFRAELAVTDDIEADLVRLATAYAAMLSRNGLIVLDFLLEAPRNPDLAEIAPIPMAAIAGAIGLMSHHQQAGRLETGPPADLVLRLLGPLIVQFAVQRAQPGLHLAITPEKLVIGFLRGAVPP